jgi:lipopolysaccharide biosynthesis glycosyltransferase
MNIVFAANKTYLPHLSAAIASLVEHHQNDALNIYIINRDFDGEDWRKLEKISHFKCHHFREIKLSNERLLNLVTGGHYRPENYFRLLIPDFIDDHKALYLDSDLIVNGSLHEFYNLDLGMHYLAAVEDAFFDRHESLEMNQSSRYFNSGVMLINLNKWRDAKVKNRVIEYVEKNPEKILFVDQDGLNSVVNGDWLMLHPAFNVQTAFYRMRDLDLLRCSTELLDAVNSPLIIHFTEHCKPWHIFNRHPNRNLYWHYLKRTPYNKVWPDFVMIFPQEWGLRYIVSKYLPIHVKNWLRKVTRH